MRDMHRESRRGGGMWEGGEGRGKIKRRKAEGDKLHESQDSACLFPAISSKSRLVPVL